MRAYFDGLLRYFEMSGRSSRRQFWLYQLVLLVIYAVGLYADWRTTGIPPNPQRHGFFAAFVLIFHAVPSMTLTVRRLHDIDKSGWAFWVLLIPVAGLIAMIVWCARASTTGANQYGEPVPLDGDADGGAYEPPPGRVVRLGRPAQRAGATPFDPSSLPTQRFI
ncbi:MAG: DUF805 domain-containing protein [Devosia sp.]